MAASGQLLLHRTERIFVHPKWVLFAPFLSPPTFSINARRSESSTLRAPILSAKGAEWRNKERSMGPAHNEASRCNENKFIN